MSIGRSIVSTLRVAVATLSVNKKQIIVLTPSSIVSTLIVAVAKHNQNKFK